MVFYGHEGLRANLGLFGLGSGIAQTELGELRLAAEAMAGCLGCDPEHEMAGEELQTLHSQLTQAQNVSYSAGVEEEIIEAAEEVEEAEGADEEEVHVHTLKVTHPGSGTVSMGVQNSEWMTSDAHMDDFFSNDPTAAPEPEAQQRPGADAGVYGMADSLRSSSAVMEKKIVGVEAAEEVEEAEGADEESLGVITLADAVRRVCEAEDGGVRLAAPPHPQRG